MENAGKQRAEARALHRLGSRKRQRAHGAAVKAAVERDDLFAARVVSRQL